jgi:hypothetical protein
VPTNCGTRVLHRAINRGEIPADTNIEAAIDLLYGPLYHRLLHRHATLNDRLVKEVIDMALPASSPPQTPPPGTPTTSGGRGHDEPPRSSPRPSKSSK